MHREMQHKSMQFCHGVVERAVCEPHLLTHLAFNEFLHLLVGLCARRLEYHCADEN